MCRNIAKKRPENRNKYSKVNVFKSPLPYLCTGSALMSVPFSLPYEETSQGAVPSPAARGS